MRFLVVSTAFLAIACGYFLFMEVQNKYKLNNIPEPVSYVERTVSTVPLAPSHSEPHSHNHTAQDEMDKVLEDLDLTESVAQLNSDDYAEAFESLEDAEAECCPEEELIDKPKKSRIQIYLDKFLPQGFSREEIVRYAELSGRQLHGTPHSFEEHKEFWELLVRFEPTEANIKSYEKLKSMWETMVPGSWRIVSRRTAD